jgi:hypothetical protein
LWAYWSIAAAKLKHATGQAVPWIGILVALHQGDLRLWEVDKTKLSMFRV